MSNNNCIQDKISVRNNLLLANMGLIYKIAHTITNRKACFEDLVNDGIVCFLQNIDNYNPSKGKLSTYMWKRIQQAMNEGVADYKQGLGTFLTSYNEAVEYLSEKNHRQPSMEEISEVMGVSIKVINHRLSDIQDRSMLSLDAPMSDDDSDNYSLQNCYTDHKDASYALIKADTRESIVKAWNRLSEKDRMVLSIRNFEEADSEKMSLREAAKIANTNKETFRLRELNATENFRKILEEYGIIA